jgi:hypothetical protein
VAIERAQADIPHLAAGWGQQTLWAWGAPEDRWMALPKDKRRTAEQAATFAKQPSSKTNLSAADVIHTKGPRVGRSWPALRFYKLGSAKGFPRRFKNFVFARGIC